MGTCPLYPLFTVEDFLEMLKALYCESDYETCHRFILASKGQPVPLDLLPNGKKRDTF